MKRIKGLLIIVCLLFVSIALASCGNSNPQSDGDIILSIPTQINK